jgi:outer membrane receptor protein involved in Fe transport
MTISDRFSARWLPATLIATLFCSCSGAALAQTSNGNGAQSAPAVDDVIVTANKRPEKIRDVAMAVSAVTGGDLQRSQSLGFEDFAAQIPGLSIQSQSAGFNKLILRGQNSGSTGASVATVVDDVPFTFSTSKGDGAFFAANIDTWDLKQIEVLRGPQGTLYGAAAEGGLIKYVTNSPNLSKYAAAGELGANTVDHGDSAGSAKVMLNIPLIEDKLAVRGSAYYEGLPAYIDNRLLGQSGINDGHKAGGRLNVLYTPTADISIKFSAYTQTLNDNGSGVVDVVGAALTPKTPPPNQFSLANGLNQNAYNPSITGNKLTYYSISLDWNLKWATLTSLTSYGKIHDHFTGDITSQNAAPGLTYGAYFGGPSGVLRSLWGSAPIKIGQDQVEELEKYNQEFRLASLPGGKLDWQVGAFFTHEKTLFNQTYNVKSIATGAQVDASYPVGYDTDPVNFDENAAFGSLTYHFTPRLSVELGGRYTVSVQHAISSTFCCVLFSNTVTTGKSNDDDFTYSISPKWNIDDDKMLYLRVATGYRPGGPLFKPSVGLTEYHSDSTTNYEAGAKVRLFDRKVTADVDVFYIDWKDIQIVSRQLGSNGVYYTQTGNAGTAKSQGIEWNFDYTPIRPLTFSFVGAYVDAQLTQDAVSLGGFKGDELAYVPKLSYTVNGNYEWSITGDYRGFVGGSWSYVGTRYTDFSTASTSTNHTKLPDYNTLAAQIGVKRGGYTLELYGKNLTDERGISYYVSQGGYGQTGQSRIIQPRTIGVLISARY